MQPFSVKYAARGKVILQTSEKAPRCREEFNYTSALQPDTSGLQSCSNWLQAAAFTRFKIIIIPCENLSNYQQLSLLSWFMTRMPGLWSSIIRTHFNIWLRILNSQEIYLKVSAQASFWGRWGGWDYIGRPKEILQLSAAQWATAEICANLCRAKAPQGKSTATLISLHGNYVFFFSVPTVVPGDG